MKTPGTYRKTLWGFTLIELLVAMAILSLVVIMTFQVIGMTWRTTASDNKRIDAVSQARQALDRFSLDWNARIARQDVAVAFNQTNGNDFISFVTAMPAPTGDRTLAVVDYQVNSNAVGTTNGYELERGVLGFNWSATDSAGSGTTSFTSPMTNLPLLEETNRQTLSPGVFRMKFALLTKATATNAAYLTNGSVTSLTNLAAVVVAVGVIDDKTRALLTTNQMQKLVEALPDPSSTSPDPLATWEAAINDPNFSSNVGISPALAQGVRVYERYFYVNLVP
jgi:prepilin-type N-terminal cleavage/methylation domain-containing protein